MEITAQPIPAILNLEQAIDKFRQAVEPLLDPAQEEDWDGSKLKAKEWTILQAGLQLVGHCIAILIYQLVMTESVKLAANLKTQGADGLNYANQVFKEVAITLIGGVQVRFEQARPWVAWLGLTFSTRRIRRISVAFCRVGLQVRARRMARLVTGDLSPGDALRGKRGGGLRGWGTH